MKDDRVAILLYSDPDTPAYWFMGWSSLHISTPVVSDKFILLPRDVADELVPQLVKLFARVDLIPGRLLKRRDKSSWEVSQI